MVKLFSSYKKEFVVFDEVTSREEELWKKISVKDSSRP
jgi:hypothetical protein